jgi:hypothetical protein
MILSIAASAQPEYAVDKGSFVLNTSGMFTSQGGDDLYGDDRLTTFMLNTSLLYFVIPNLAIGGNFELLTASLGGDSETLFGIGPEIDYFFGTEETNLYPFIGGSFLYSNLSDAYSATFINFHGGINYMLTTHVGLLGQAFFQLENYNPEGDGDSLSGNTFGLAFGISAFLY